MAIPLDVVRLARKLARGRHDLPKLPKLARLWENRPGGGRPQRLALLRRQLAQVHDTQWTLWRWRLLALLAWNLALLAWQNSAGLCLRLLRLLRLLLQICLAGLSWLACEEWGLDRHGRWTGAGLSLDWRWTVWP